MKRHIGEWSYSFTILDLGTKLGWVVTFMPGPLDPKEISPPPLPPDTHWIGGWVSHRAGLDDTKK
jgi:hypothetical protein